MKKHIALLLALVMVFALTACGGEKDNDPNLGKYVGATVEVFGEDVNISEIYSEGENYIELRSGGKCVFTLDGDSASGKWKLDGNDIVLTIEDMDSTGTLKDGVLTIDFMGEGIMMTFVKDGATAPTTDAASKPTDEPQSLGDAWWINKLMAGAQYRRRESRRSRMSTGKGREKRSCRVKNSACNPSGKAGQPQRSKKRNASG